jgi:hypothetical protein
VGVTGGSLQLSSALDVVTTARPTHQRRAPAGFAVRVSRLIARCAVPSATGDHGCPLEHSVVADLDGDGDR